MKRDLIERKKAALIKFEAEEKAAIEQEKLRITGYESETLQPLGKSKLQTASWLSWCWVGCVSGHVSGFLFRCVLFLYPRHVHNVSDVQRLFSNECFCLCPRRARIVSALHLLLSGASSLCPRRVRIKSGLHLLLSNVRFCVSETCPQGV